ATCPARCWLRGREVPRRTPALRSAGSPGRRSAGASRGRNWRVRVPASCRRGTSLARCRGCPTTAGATVSRSRPPDSFGYELSPAEHTPSGFRGRPDAPELPVAAERGRLDLLGG